MDKFFFCIAHIFLHDEYEELCQRDGVFFAWTEGMFLHNFQSRSQHMSNWVGEFGQDHSDAPGS